MRSGGVRLRADGSTRRCRALVGVGGDAGDVVVTKRALDDVQMRKRRRGAGNTARGGSMNVRRVVAGTRRVVTGSLRWRRPTVGPSLHDRGLRQQLDERSL